MVDRQLWASGIPIVGVPGSHGLGQGAKQRAEMKRIMDLCSPTAGRMTLVGIDDKLKDQTAQPPAMVALQWSIRDKNRHATHPDQAHGKDGLLR